MAKGLEIKKTGKTNVPVIQKDIVNQDETVEALDNMRKQIADPANYQQNFLSVLKDIKETAKYYCPKDTHALANSIRLIKNDSEQKLDKSLAKSKSILNYTFIAGNPNKKNSKGKPINYGAFIHDGHFMPSGRRYSGVPFFKLALEVHREELDEAIDKVWKKLGKKFSNENNKKK